MLFRSDLRYIATSDVGLRVSCDVRELLEDLLAKEQMPPVMQKACSDLLRILNPENLAGRITWIESMIDGSKTIKSVPETIAPLLRDTLFSLHPTTLIIPPKSHEALGAILSPSISTTLETLSSHGTVRVDCSSHASLEDLLRGPIDGKMIVLVASKRSIEDIYVRHSDYFEERGAALLCQGFAGGQGRMQAEFMRAPQGSALVMTPWMYEGMDLPQGTATTLVLQTLPFDHPNHAVVSRRALRLKDPFNEYSLPRLTQRLWRLLRSFARHAITGGTVMILDDRLRTKAYGKFLTTYLHSLSSNVVSSNDREATPLPKKKVRSTTKGTSGQMTLF